MLHKIKSIIQVLILIIILILSLSLIKSISKIVGSNQKLVDASQKVQKLKEENAKLAKNLQEAESPQFVESQARDKLGLAKKGEIVVVLPDETTLRALAPKMESEKPTLPDPVWKKWLKLFL
ncbi:hypothetical protein BH10PAT1_BH10PAT1_7170 [soil metagenome]